MLISCHDVFWLWINSIWNIYDIYFINWLKWSRCLFIDHELFHNDFLHIALHVIRFDQQMAVFGRSLSHSSRPSTLHPAGSDLIEQQISIIFSLINLFIWSNKYLHSQKWVSEQVNKSMWKKNGTPTMFSSGGIKQIKLLFIKIWNE